MGLFGKIAGIFKRSEGETQTEPETTPELPPELPKPPTQPTVETPSQSTPTSEPESIPELPPSLQPPLPTKGKENVEAESLKAKIDLLITQVENLKVQSENINERLKIVEKLLQEMRRIRYY